MFQSKGLMAVVCMLAVFAIGCDNSKVDDKSKDGSDKSVMKDSGHSHAHGHVHGPKGGEMFEFADLGLKGEWVGKYSQDLVMFYLYEKDGKTECPVKVEKLVGSFKEGDELKTFDIEATNSKDGMASRFEIVSEEVARVMKNAGMNLELTDSDGKKHTVKLDKDPH